MWIDAYEYISFLEFETKNYSNLLTKTTLIWIAKNLKTLDLWIVLIAKLIQILYYLIDVIYTINLDKKQNLGYSINNFEI